LLSRISFNDLSSSRMKEETETLGQLIRRARLEKGLTQSELSAAAGYEYNVVGAWETSQKRVQVTKIPLVAKALNLPEEALLAFPEDILHESKPNKGSRMIPEICRRIVQLREEQHLNMREMADILGIKSSHYFRIEKEDAMPTLEQVRKIARTMGVSYAWLLDGPPNDRLPYAKLQAKIEVVESQLAEKERELRNLHSLIDRANLHS
jgi:transcriptional regulator with XRE-family HTH domain